MSELYNGTTIRTVTGLYMDVFNPTFDMISIEDIAHSLSFQCRFGGHLKQFYSVAQHSYHVSKRVHPKQALAGLLHDATEAYLLDMPRPIKQRLPEYKAVEDNLMRVIAERFGLDWPLDPQIKEVDKYMLELEYKVLVEGPITHHIIPMSPPLAKIYFLQRFDELKGRNT